MSEIEVEVEEAGERLQELADAVIRGQKVWIMSGGEPAALATLEYLNNTGPSPALRRVVLATLEGAVNHLRKRPPTQPWCTN